MFFQKGIRDNMSDLPKRLSQKAIILALLGGDTACIPETIKEHMYKNIYVIYINIYIYTCICIYI